MRKQLLLLMGMLSFILCNAQIKVDASKSYLTTSDGKPFFWLADTGWELFHRLNREEAIQYLDARKEQGFNVILAVTLAQNTGLTQPNYYGDLPFKNLQSLEWAETPGNDSSDSVAYDYWDHVDYIIKEAAKRKLYIGLLPAWGDKVLPSAPDPAIFSDENRSYTYGKKIAERYKKLPNIIWILGGDRPPRLNKWVNGEEIIIHDYRPIWRAMAKGIQDVSGKDVFIAYHPGWHTSEYFKDEDKWLSMNAIQSGHASRNFKIWDSIRVDLQATPKRPFMDLEPCYEDHPVNPWDGRWTRESRGYFNDYDVRARIYRGVFAGACGAVYGHHSIWQFLDTARNYPIWNGDTIITWQKALTAKASTHIHYLRELMESHKDFNRMEDSLLIASDRGSDYRDLIIATMNRAGKYAMIYLPRPTPIQVNLDRLQKGKKRITWFNPVTGKKNILEKKQDAGIVSVTPPNKEQPDWVLIIDVI